MAIDFLNIEAVVFNLDGVLYDDSDLITKMKFADILHARWITKDKKVRENDLVPKQGAFYPAYFARMSKECNVSEEKYRIWYFTKFLPNMCNIIKHYNKYRDGIDEIFIQLKRCKIPFLIYSDYALAKDRTNAIGLKNLEDFHFICGDELGVRKTSEKGFKLIEEQVLYKKPSGEQIIVVGIDEKRDGLGAINAGYNYIKITDEETNPTNYTEMTWEQFTNKLINALRQLAVKKGH